MRLRFAWILSHNPPSSTESASSFFSLSERDVRSSDCLAENASFSLACLIANCALAVSLAAFSAAAAAGSAASVAYLTFVLRRLSLANGCGATKLPPTSALFLLCSGSSSASLSLWLIGSLGASKFCCFLIFSKSLNDMTSFGTPAASFSLLGIRAVSNLMPICVARVSILSTIASASGFSAFVRIRRRPRLIKFSGFAEDSGLSTPIIVARTRATLILSFGRSVFWVNSSSSINSLSVNETSLIHFETICPSVPCTSK